MKLAAIYNVWDGVELLRGSMNCLKYHVDMFIIVWQDVSNFGEHYEPLKNIDFSKFKNVVLYKYYPKPTGAMRNETEKRNVGLDIARDNNCTHFLHVDVDEYYDDFGSAKELFCNSGFNGSYCRLYTYFKHAVLRFEKADDYFVPFIHKLTPNTRVGMTRYPVLVDPTRSVNESSLIELPVFMHHYSYVRADINRKLRNSSAKVNIDKILDQIMDDYEDARPGYRCRSYSNMKLIKVENKFNIHV